MLGFGFGVHLRTDLLGEPGDPNEEGGLATIADLVSVLDDVITAGSPDLGEVGDKILQIIAGGSQPYKTNLLMTYGDIDAGDRENILDKMLHGSALDGPFNRGAFIKFDGAGEADGRGFGGTTIVEQLEGETDIMPADPENAAELVLFVEVSGDVVSGTPDTLTVDFMVTPAARLTYDADVELTIASLSVGATGKTRAFPLEIENTDASDIDITPQLAGDAVLVLQDPVPTTITIAPGDVVTLYFVPDLDGNFKVSYSIPTTA